MCFVDAATGHFTLGQCSDDLQKNCLRTLLAQLRPSEVIFDSTNGSRESYLLLRRSVQENLLSTVSDASQFWTVDAAAKELGAAACCAPRQRRACNPMHPGRGPTHPGCDPTLAGAAAYFEGGEAAWPAPLREAAAMKPPLALGAYGACARTAKHAAPGSSRAGHARLEAASRLHPAALRAPRQSRRPPGPCRARRGA